ncbi:hypothetical protein CTAYLR_008909 [Chrysophaeum taylorii]|uniref:Uncharacterized protein n=1 Tax=Chrysophaeum taylorii TaxID=2483200 RepID=A0AAD7UB65_9STRA|nr:hypothetical protein CTAYLR_008909 [Chrysophaeum taylorii]
MLIIRHLVVIAGHWGRTALMTPILVACAVAAMLEPWLPSPRAPLSTNLRGKRIVITGANAGVGKHAALRLAKQGAEVVLACRNPSKAEAVRAEIEAASGTAAILRVDLLSFESVRAAARALGGSPIDVLLLNAGTNANVPTLRHPDADCSTVFGVNFLAQWLLLKLLARTTVVRRVVCLGSVMHHVADIQAVFEDRADYSESKLAMILLARDLDRGGGLFDDRIPAVAANPGAVSTEIWRYTPAFARPLFDLVARSIFLTPDQGAATSVHAATCALPPATDALYFAPYWQPSLFPSAFEWFGPFSGGANITYCRLPSNERAIASQLWRKCESLCGSALSDPL